MEPGATDTFSKVWYEKKKKPLLQVYNIRDKLEENILTNMNSKYKDMIELKLVLDTFKESYNNVPSA